MATPAGRGSIAVIRVSGPQTLDICGSLFDRELPEAGCHRFGNMLRADGTAIDEVVLSCFKAPHSYSGEDVIEITTHGNQVIVSELLDLLYKNTARPAQPGEFSFRAFLNGRIDLTQAEAVADLIDAGSRQAASQAIRQLKGGISDAVDQICEAVTSLLLQCELELDFVEEDVELLRFREKMGIVRTAMDGLDKLLSGYKTSRSLRKGVKVAIVGAPNVGKSSLFNILLQDNRAIVHDTPGTTRDVLSGSCLINGVRFDLFDTAGLRVSKDEIEDEGIKRAVEAAEKAEIIIHVHSPDVSCNIVTDFTRDAATIRIMNKSDLNEYKDTERMIGVSALSGKGIDELRQLLYDKVADDNVIGATSISRERHYIAVKQAEKALLRVEEGLRSSLTSELIAEDLREAMLALNSLTGKHRLDGLLERIFSEFCIGK